MITMKKIYSKHIPRKGFTAMTIWPYIIVRSDRKEKFTAKTERHETTHALQQKEMLLIFFFAMYGLEWVLKLPFCKFDAERAYYSISFEQEAYEHEAEFGYNNVRKHYAFIKYIFTLTPKRK